MSRVALRKTLVTIESIFHDGGAHVVPPVTVGVAAAVIQNPFAGVYVEGIAPFMDELTPLALDLSQMLLKALGGEKRAIESYGKGSIVGVNGELEHAALWHVPGGAAVREVLGAKSFVPSAKMMGSVGARLMIPLLSISSVWVRSHYGIAEFTIHDAPRPNEIAVAVAMSTGGRVQARIGGLSKQDAEAGLGPKA
jgi:hypothetical protein